MTTAPYLVIGTSPFTGIDTVDECDTYEEARSFAHEHGGKVVKAEDYRPQGDWRAPLDEDVYLETPWLAEGWLSKAEWLYEG